MNNVIMGILGAADAELSVVSVWSLVTCLHGKVCVLCVRL